MRACAKPRRAAGSPSGSAGHHGSQAIRARDDLRMSLDDAAQLAFLSPSRFAHLFKDQVGLPYSRYMLWRKLTRAMVAIASERTIAAAAHAADFADAAHLTRTFYQMVGMAPSVLMRGKFAEIRSPFFGSSGWCLRGCAGSRTAHPIADSFIENSRFIQSRAAVPMRHFSCWREPTQTQLRVKGDSNVDEIETV